MLKKANRSETVKLDLTELKELSNREQKIGIVGIIEDFKSKQAK
jgi:hypothetical protein